MCSPRLCRLADRLRTPWSTRACTSSGTSTSTVSAAQNLSACLGQPLNHQPRILARCVLAPVQWTIAGAQRPATPTASCSQIRSSSPTASSQVRGAGTTSQPMPDPTASQPPPISLLLPPPPPQWLITFTARASSLASISVLARRLVGPRLWKTRITASAKKNSQPRPSPCPGRGGRPGSYGHYEQDAKTIAGWGMDYAKFDNCHKCVQAGPLSPSDPAPPSTCHPINLHPRQLT